MTVPGPNGADGTIHRSLPIERLMVDAATIDVTITFLAMDAPPTSLPPPAPAVAHAIMRANNPTVSFYRYLYHTIGEDYLWWERRALSDDELRTIITSDAVEVFVFYVDGVPAGYFEIVTDTKKDEVDIGYFGLLPEFVGRRLGAYLLRAAIDEAWSRNPGRVTVNTCTLDHPQALPNYQRAGFTPCDQKTIQIVDPRTLGYF